MTDQDDVLIATVRIRRGPGWAVKPEAEALEGRTHRFTYGWRIRAPSIYAGEIAWIVAPEGWPEDAPLWIASGDLVEAHVAPAPDGVQRSLGAPPEGRNGSEAPGHAAGGASGPAAGLSEETT